MKGRVSVSWGARNWATPVHFLLFSSEHKETRLPLLAVPELGKYKNMWKAYEKVWKCSQISRQPCWSLLEGLGLTNTNSLLALGRGSGVISQDTLQGLVPPSSEAGRGPTPADPDPCIPCSGGILHPTHPACLWVLAEIPLWNSSGKGTKRGGSCTAQLAPKTALESPK